MERAIDQLKHDSFYSEACRHCDKWNLPAERIPAIELALRYQAFRQAIEPFIKGKVKAISLAMPRWAMGENGFEMVDDGITEDMRKTLTAYDELILQMAKQYGFELPPELVRSQENATLK